MKRAKPIEVSGFLTFKYIREHFEAHPKDAPAAK